MPKLTEITVSVGLTINLGDYESLRRDVTVTVAAEDGDAPEALDMYARAQAESALANALESDVIRRATPGVLMDKPEASIRAYLSRNPVFQALMTLRPYQGIELANAWVEQYAAKPVMAEPSQS